MPYTDTTTYAPALHHFGQMHAVPLPAAQIPHALLLHRALEVEGRHVGARADGAVAHLWDLCSCV